MRHLTGFAISCLLAGMAPMLAAPEPEPAALNFPGWPDTFEGRPLHALPLKDFEQRFADDLPGRLGKFSDGTREYMFQWIESRSRLIHPATDCMANAGFAVSPEPLWLDVAGHRWSSAKVRRGEQQLRVRECIYASDGQSWYDHSSWYWSTVLGQSHGPWWVITIIESVPDED